MWIIEFRIIQLVRDLLSQLKCGRKRSDDEQVTLPENMSNQRHHMAQAPEERSGEDRELWEGVWGWKDV
jgi:hypothetical protein